MLELFWTQLTAAKATIWQDNFNYIFLVNAVLLLPLSRTQHNGSSLVRNMLVFAGFCLLIFASSMLTQALALSFVATTLNQIGVVSLGVLTIRLIGLNIFRGLLPLIGLTPPRILEDIILVLAYAGWGLVQMSKAGVNLSGLVTTSAVITGIIAFSMQETLGNILGGLALQLDESITIGDWVKIDDTSGRVIEVHWRHTAIRTRNGEIVVLPNSLLMKAKVTIVGGEDVSQWRRWVHFSTSNQCPPQKVIEIVETSLQEAEIPWVSRKPAPNCVLMDFKEGQSFFAVRYWLTNPEVDDPTDSAVRTHIYAALQRHNQELWMPQQQVYLTAESREREQYRQAAEFDRRKQTLQHIELFQQLSDEELDHLARTLTDAPFIKGDVITRQGAVAHWLYVLVAGEVDIWLEINPQERKLLSTLTAGSIFGEMGLMTGEPRRATVIAHTNCECYRLDKENFEYIIHERPQLAEEFAKILAERNRQLVAVKQNNGESHEQHQARLLASIKRFFRLES